MNPGISSFLIGIEPLMRYLEHVGKLGFPINQIKFKKADRTFHFGGDYKAVSPLVNFLSSICRPWSPIQNINAKTPQYQE